MCVIFLSAQIAKIQTENFQFLRVQKATIATNSPSRYLPVVGITAHVEHPIVIAAATETPRGERSHAVRAHVA
jgi:hypothetical protein